MNKKGPITATFIDEITYDIPSSNWSAEEWKKDLDNMVAVGIDTLVFIRGGFENKSIFPSRLVGTPWANDFAGFILAEAAKRNMKVFMGLYISNLTWNDGDINGELKKNKIFIDEIMERYSDCPAFYGWYIPHEVATECLGICEITHGLSSMCKDKTPEKPVLISPFFALNTTPEKHFEEWHKIFSKCGSNVDICAFQDGSACYSGMDMTGLFGVTKKLCDEFKIHHWVNAETFERDVRFQYLPMPFQMLKHRLDLHAQYAEKIMTFEFSHFLSPQSIYPSARNLNHLYTEYYIKGNNISPL